MLKSKAILGRRNSSWKESKTKELSVVSMLPIQMSCRFCMAIGRSIIEPVHAIENFRDI